MSEASPIARVLRSHLGVRAGYRHAPKRVRAGTPLHLDDAILKWYELHPEDRPVPDAIAALAREIVTSGRIGVAGLGFVVLHRCGGDFYFLIVNTWRNENEIWETVWYKDGDAMAEFAEFQRKLPHIPTYCVWELMPVWHEKQAWERFLLSGRDEAAAQRWLADLYEGVA